MFKDRYYLASMVKHINTFHHEILAGHFLY